MRSILLLLAFIPFIGFTQTNTFPSSGNTGIGTTSPTSKLELYTSSDYDGIKLIHSAGGVVRLQSNSLQGGSFNDITQQGDAGIVFGNVSGASTVNFGFVITPWRSGLSGLRMDSLGNVAIGTADPKGYKLAVNGDAIFTKVKVKTYATWPDYVFHRNYNLRPLRDLENYIKQNNHLPGVPSASDVEKNGLDLGDNQATLLKKIEELTMYMIDLNKKVDKLSQENTSLKKKVAAIKAKK